MKWCIARGLVVVNFSLEAMAMARLRFGSTGLGFVKLAGAGLALPGLALAGLALIGLVAVAGAQSLTPPPGATYGQPLSVPPMRPLYYSPFTNYDLIYGYSRGALTAPQPIGHEHIPTGPNGYIYQPVYATPTPPPMPPAQSRAATNSAGMQQAGPQQVGVQQAGPQQVGVQQAAPGSPSKGPSILRRFSDAPPPAPESVVEPPPAKPANPAGPREF
ncbi:MAG TPA: hypothetical protein VHY20_06465 [Pirellulales bacterium]|jgi:hypothetical protein|nr:hypothetical protein [Pirellulales bacterium]